jgi:hypothetical protein
MYAAITPGRRATLDLADVMPGTPGGNSGAPAAV